jgi:hypothetical protein
MLSPEELTDLQADMEGLALSTTADIQRNASLGQPVKGSTPDNWQSILTNGPVSAGYMLANLQSGYLQQYAGLLANQQAWVVTLKKGQSIQVHDRILIAGLTLTVHALLGQGSYQTLTQVLATKVGA